MSSGERTTTTSVRDAGADRRVARGTTEHRPSWRNELAADYELMRARLEVRLEFSGDDAEEYL